MGQQHQQQCGRVYGNSDRARHASPGHVHALNNSLACQQRHHHPPIGGWRARGRARRLAPCGDRHTPDDADPAPRSQRAARQRPGLWTSGAGGRREPPAARLTMVAASRGAGPPPGPMPAAAGPLLQAAALGRPPAPLLGPWISWEVRQADVDRRSDAASSAVQMPSAARPSRPTWAGFSLWRILSPSARGRSPIRAATGRNEAHPGPSLPACFAAPLWPSRLLP